jgi:hypothetical protein
MWFLGMIATHRFQYSEDDILISRSRLPDQPYEVVLIGLNPGWDLKRSRRTFTWLHSPSTLDAGQPRMAISTAFRSCFLATPLLACTARPEFTVMR